MEGEDNNLKGFITKRRKGYVSSIRFGGARLRNLLKGVEIVCKEESKLKRCFEWKENVRPIDWKTVRTRQDVFCCIRSQTEMENGIGFFSQKEKVL